MGDAAETIALTEPIALPVRHPPAALPAEEQVDRAGQEASAGHLQALQRFGIAPSKAATGVTGEGLGQAAAAHQTDLPFSCRQGEIEVHLIEPRTGLQVPQTAGAKGTAEGSEHQLLQPLEEAFAGLAPQAGPLQFLLDHRIGLLPFPPGHGAVVEALEDAVQGISRTRTPGEMGEGA